MNKVTIDPGFYESFNKLDDEEKLAVESLIADITDLVEAGDVDELIVKSECVCAKCYHRTCRCHTS